MARAMGRSGVRPLADAPAIPRPIRAPPSTLPTMVDAVPSSAPMSARITTPGIMSKVSPVTSSIATPRRITTRVALPSAIALVRRPRLVDPMAHHLKEGEGGERGASHRPACDHPRCYTDRCYHPLRVIGAPGHSGSRSSHRLRSWQRPVQHPGLMATPWWLLQHGDL